MIDKRQQAMQEMLNRTPDYSKIRIGNQVVEDAVYQLSNFKKSNPRLGDKKNILKAIANEDYDTMRDISNYFYKTSGIYNRLCRYMAYMYRYDWMVTPYVYSESASTDKILNNFNKVLTYLDNFEVKRVFGEIALKVIKNGSYYGYLIRYPARAAVQELPPKYCRSRFMSSDGRPLVEFNMRFFDENFRDTTQRLKMLDCFPIEFKKAYILYKQGKLPPAFQGDISGWYLLNADAAIKFSINGDDFPNFISVIPAIIDLDEAQELDRKKMQQQLLKIVIQKMPMDKNGEMIFDPDEIQVFHSQAVRMLSRAIGVDVLTTFADTSVESMSDDNTTASIDGLEKVEREVYNAAGVSQMQFNTDGNIALEKSILNDEASMYNLIQQFEAFLNLLIEPFNKSKKIQYRASILNTTIYNYKEMSKLFKEQSQLGHSKTMAQIALGQPQSAVYATAYFENDILDLASILIPPMSSNTMNAQALSDSEDKKTGRPEKNDDEKSEKTIQNKESMS